MAQQLGISRIKSTTPSNSKPPTKRKAASLTPDYRYDEGDDAERAEAAAQATLAGIDISKPKRARKKKGEEPEEKRLRRARAKPPVTYLERLSRVKTQRMFLIDRERSMSQDGTHKVEEFSIAGTTGNIYKVVVSKVPTCTCPDGAKGNQCMYILYFFHPQNALELQNISVFERRCFTTRETLNRNFRSYSFLEQTMLTSTRQTHHLCAGEHPQDP